jgi:hypothetical protein
MAVSFGAVAPFFIGFMLIVIMPLVPVIMVIPDKFLARRRATEMIVIPAVLIIMQIRLRLVHDDLMAMIKIEVVIAGRQLMRKRPMAPVQVDEFMRRNIIVRLDIGNIIIFHMIIPGRSPGWLVADVDGKLDLSLCRMRKSKHAEHEAGD